MADSSTAQAYDSLLKRLVHDQPDVVLPLLFPELAREVVEELNIELLLPARRTDRVYKTRPEDSRDTLEILHVEFEVSANHKMDKRLLVYHALLLEKYELPVHSIVIYPFEVSMVSSPLLENSAAREILSFHFGTLPLWKQDARLYLKRRAIPLYGLLPAMGNGNKDLLLQALEEMIDYYKTDETRLRDELLCFQVLLTHAQRLPEAERLEVERRLRMFDPLLEQDPWVQGKLAERAQQALLAGKEAGRVEGLLEGRAEGLLEGKLQIGRNLLLTIVRQRFPELALFAERCVARIEQADVLEALAEKLLQATSEEEVRSLFAPYDPA